MRSPPPSATAESTLTASATTSTPTPSPGMSATLICRMPLRRPLREKALAGELGHDPADHEGREHEAAEHLEAEAPPRARLFALQEGEHQRDETGEQQERDEM